MLGIISFLDFLGISKPIQTPHFSVEYKTESFEIIEINIYSICLEN